MATVNKTKEPTTDIVVYEAGGREVVLSPQVVRNYLVQGNGRVTDQEVAMFIELCRFKGMNPFLREAYLIKYGTAPATTVAGKDFFTRKAAENPACRGWEAGVIVKGEGGLVYRKGSFVCPEEELVGGYSIIYRDGWEPLENSVSLREYMRYNTSGQKQSNWANMPGTMIRKVALVQGLREAFPEQFGGLYSQEEMPTGDAPLDERPIDSEVVREAQELTDDDLVPSQEEVVALNKNLGKLKKQLAEALGCQLEEITQSMVDYSMEMFGKGKPSQLTRAEWRNMVSWMEGRIAASHRKAEEAIQEVMGGELVEK